MELKDFNSVFNNRSNSVRVDSASAEPIPNFSDTVELNEGFEVEDQCYSKPNALTNAIKGEDGDSLYVTYSENAIDSEPSPPTGSANSGEWSRTATADVNWISIKEGDSNWGNPILLTKGLSAIEVEGKTVTRTDWSSIGSISSDNLKDFINEVFFPNVAPSLSITSIASREYGDGNTSVSVIYAATLGQISDVFQTLTINGTDILDDGTSQSGTYAATIALDYVTKTFTLLYTSSLFPSGASTSKTLTYRYRSYWGTVPTGDLSELTGLGADSDYTALSGVTNISIEDTGASTQLLTSRGPSTNSFATAGEARHIFYIWPQSFESSATSSLSDGADTIAYFTDENGVNTVPFQRYALNGFDNQYGYDVDMVLFVSKYAYSSSTFGITIS